MEFSLSAAAKATKKGKSTIHNAIKSGKLSARRLDDGSYRIDASELARVFTLNPSMNGKPDDLEPQVEPQRMQGVELAEMRVKVEMLERMLDSEQANAADLRKRLDRAEERVHALTFQAQTQPMKAVGFLGRLLGR